MLPASAAQLCHVSQSSNPPTPTPCACVHCLRPQPHATMLLRNRSRRALTRFVSALFSDVPAVLSRTVVPVDGALRALTPPTPGDGGADPRKAAQTFRCVC
jgi:hypothetical protein